MGKVSKTIIFQSGIPDRGRDALDLRIRGYSFKAIAEELKISPATAYRRVADALKEARELYREKADELLHIELDRIDRMVTALEKYVFPPDEVGEAVPQNFEVTVNAIEMVNKLLDRKAKLLGFYRQNDNATKEPLPWNDEE